MPRQRVATLSILTVLLLILVPIALAVGAEMRPYAPTQGGFTSTSAEQLPYAPDRLLVQFTKEAMARSQLQMPLDKGAAALDATTGLASVDVLAVAAGVQSIVRPYHMPQDAEKAAVLGVDRWFMMRFDTTDDLADLAETLRADPNVSAVSLDWRAFPTTSPNDPLYTDHWGHNNTAQLPGYDWGGTWDHTGPPVGTPGFDSNAEQAWDASQGYGDASVVIAILDSGVDIDHPDLRLVSGWDFGSGDSNPDDNSSSPGHGTACAGVAASVRNSLGSAGIAADCSIMPCKVANNQGTMYFSYIQNALYWAADNGADVISLSLGAYIDSDSATDTALQYAYNAGVTIFAATANENYSYIAYPACNQYVIAVGAASPCGDRKRSSSNSSEVNPGVNTDPNGYTCDGERWWGSCYGQNTQDHRKAVDILGPTILPTTDIGGSGGYQTGDYEPFFNGTSCATPYVAGVGALVIAANPGFTPAQVRDAIVSNAEDVVNVESGVGWDRYSGYGMVDAAAAVGGGGPVAPTAEFAGSPTSGTEPLNVDFTDQSLGSPTSWSWTFGDGGTSTAQNPSHTYTSAGNYTVSLTATNVAGSDTETKNNYITVNPCNAPVAAFVGSPTSGYAPLAVSFTDQSTNSPTSWSWTFGDGGTSSAQNPSHTYTSVGTYTVTLTATNSCGSDAATRTDYISVTEEPGGSWVTITYDDFEGGFGNYTDGGGDCSLYSGGTYAHQGSRAIDIQDNSGTASSFYHTSGYNVTGYTELEVEFWFFPRSMESGEDFWLQYYNGSSWQTVESWARGVDFVNNSFYHEVVSIPSGSYNYPTNAKLRFRCDASGNGDDIYVDEVEFRGRSAGPVPPTAEFSGTPTSGDYPLEVGFTDESTGSPTSWSWTFGDGGTSTAQNPSHTYTAAGDYTVSLTATNAEGSDTETKANYITVTEPGSGGWTTITYDDFEGGFGNYTDGGGDCRLYTGGTYAHQGSNAADIQDNSGTASSFYHTNGQNVTGYSDLEVEFWFRAQSMDNSNEDFWLQYYDGSSWQTVETWARGVDFENGIFYNEVVTISSGSYTFPSNAKLRFMCDASANRDDVYIDEIEFRGYSSSKGARPTGDAPALPSEFAVSQNYPNPFNPSTVIDFALPATTKVRLAIFDVRGRRVATLADGEFAAGRHSVRWNAAEVASGVYFYRIQAGEFVETKSMMLVK